MPILVHHAGKMDVFSMTHERLGSTLRIRAGFSSLLLLPCHAILQNEPRAFLYPISMHYMPGIFQGYSRALCTVKPQPWVRAPKTKSRIHAVWAPRQHLRCFESCCGGTVPADARCVLRPALEKHQPIRRKNQGSD